MEQDYFGDIITGTNDGFVETVVADVHCSRGHAFTLKGQARFVKIKQLGWIAASVTRIEGSVLRRRRDRVAP